MDAPARSHSPLTLDEVRRVAALSRLALNEEQLEAARAQMGAVLGHMNTLRQLDLANVEPMAYPSDIANRMDDDTPRAGLPTSALMDMAPDKAPPFVKVPKVIAGSAGSWGAGGSGGSGGAGGGA